MEGQKNSLFKNEWYKVVLYYPHQQNKKYLPRITYIFAADVIEASEKAKSIGKIRGNKDTKVKKLTKEGVEKLENVIKSYMTMEKAMVYGFYGTRYNEDGRYITINIE